MLKKILLVLLGFVGILLMAVVLYNLPPIHDRLAWRVDNLRTSIKYTLNPPEEVVFLPAEAEATLPPPTSTATPTLTPVPAGPTDTPPPTLVPTVTNTPLPGNVLLSGVKYEDQHGRLNYCGPSNLSMALTYWGWDGNRDVVGQAIKPMTDDKNVMPYEMQDFIAQHTELDSIVRVGGDIELVKALVAAGFPVILEKGTFLTDLAGAYSWMGHYQLVTGYDDAQSELIVQDTYVGADHAMSYADINNGWRAFDYLYLVAYPPDQEQQVAQILGPRWDEAYSTQLAAERASEEIFNAADESALYFAWFNRGTSLMMLQDYAGAADAYDQAFASVYPNIAEDERPWRMMWYQTGPYWAYFYSGRYYDVISLATTTLDAMSKPVLEESYYWRALAREALGDTSGAIADLKEAVRLNPNFLVGQQQLDRIQGGA
jgi:hypothetical protein